MTTRCCSEPAASVTGPRTHALHRNRLGRPGASGWFRLGTGPAWCGNGNLIQNLHGSQYFRLQSIDHARRIPWRLGASDRRPGPVETVEPVSSWADRETGGNAGTSLHPTPPGNRLGSLFVGCPRAARVSMADHEETGAQSPFRTQGATPPDGMWEHGVSTPEGKSCSRCLPSSTGSCDCFQPTRSAFAW